MKAKFLIALVFLSNVHAVAQESTPVHMAIVMIGKSAKPVLDLCIFDTADKSENKFDEHTIVLPAGSKTLSNLYSLFQHEEKFDPLKKYDYSFGTFLFVFHFANKQKVKVVAVRNQSVLYFRRMIAVLSPKNDSEALISKEIDYNLLKKIDY